MAMINPAQVALLKEMQPEFNFQERKVLPMEAAATGTGDNLIDNDELGGQDNINGESVGGFSDQSMTDLLGLNGNLLCLSIG